ncbi:MAG TPA: antibiotic biosynthesis monooxygenase [Micromonosporaceae bacterium]|nr:antibiotic biosynthesis monooxygenase [Micromonosporaceae bacterium]
MTAWVLLFAAAPDGPKAVADAYHDISRRLCGTPGLVRNTLLELVDSPGRFVVASEWTSLSAFRAWEEGADHRRLTAPLRPYHDRAMGGGYGIYEVTAEYRSLGS